MKRISVVTGVALGLLVVIGMALQIKVPKSSAPAVSALIDRVDEPWTGDIDEIIEKRLFVRVLVAYNQTHFFIDQGAPRGIEYELLKQYEAFLNQDRGDNSLKVKIVFRVLPFDRLLPALMGGEGDIVAAGLTISPQAAEAVAFTHPYFSDIREVLVTCRDRCEVNTIEALAGKRVHVPAGSSYANHLQAYNPQLLGQFLDPIRVVEVAPQFEPEDLLRMVNAGIYEYTVVDAHMAELWAKVLPNIQVHPNVEIHRGGAMAWALRKDNPQLMASLNEFIRANGQGTYNGNLVFNRYYENPQWMQNPLSSDQKELIETFKAYVKKYADIYNMDWLKVAALAYQESHLDPNAKSPRGAVGIMQVMPSTAAGDDIGIADIYSIENNIHAGIRYLAYLRDNYFSDPVIAPENRIYFAIAAYNAGPTRILLMRQKAREKGLDPNVWFSNVEATVLEHIGLEPVQYVSNIYSYYVAYKSAFDVINRKPLNETAAPIDDDFLRRSDT
ncbi:MAG: transporter substrate-binding domain-containing protein [Desulfobacteraceae bacterium]|nr:transporter substrate-binding domain-containing protein [Desulfobacteraceae bacterium]